jgi:hypothetical protein
VGSASGNVVFIHVSHGAGGWNVHVKRYTSRPSVVFFQETGNSGVGVQETTEIPAAVEEVP